jgi:flavodoxin short chain
MSKYKVIYSTMTGNTEEMARAVKEGIESEGHSVELLKVKNATQELIDEASGVALGCPAMGAEVLSDEMAAFVSTVNVQDKSLVLFGSYDWGDGEWMEDWEVVMKKNGANLKTKGLIVHTEPSGEDLEACKTLGKRLI